MTKQYIQMIILFFLVACSSTESGSCDDSASTPYPSPPPPGGQIQSEVLRARLTDGLLSFFESNLSALMAPALSVENGEARFELDASLAPEDGSIQFQTGSYFALKVDELNSALSLEWLPDPTGVRVTLDDLKLYTDMVITTDFDTAMVPQAACRVRSIGNTPALTIPHIGMDIEISVTGTGGESQLAVTPQAIQFQLGSDSQQSSILVQIDPCTDCGLSCGPGSDCAQVCGVLDVASSLGDFILDMLEPMIAQLGTVLEASIGQTISNALQDLPLGAETQVDIAATGGPMFRATEPLLVKAQASQSFGVTGTGPAKGLGMAIDSGLSPATPALCAQNSAPPDLNALQGPPPIFTSFVELTDDQGQSRFQQYHAALAASEALLSQAAWGAFSAGALCVDIGTEDINDLTDGAFSVTSGLLINFDGQLLGLADLDAPLLMRIFAQESPRIRIGEGRPLPDGSFDPLLQFSADDLRIDIHMFIDGTQMRVVGLISDLTMDININRDAESQVQLVVENITVKNVRQVYSELAPNADLTGLFAFVVQFAVDNLLGDNLQFDLDFSETLSDGAGIPVTMQIVTIQRDQGATGVPYLSAYLMLCSEEDVADATNPVCFPPPVVDTNNATDLNLDEQQSFYRPLPPVPNPEGRWAALTSGVAFFDVDPQDPREFQFRVDRGVWTNFKRPNNHRLKLYNPRLKLLGHHQIDMRARLPKGPFPPEITQSFAVLIDTERPELTLNVNEGRLQAHVEELVSPETLEVLWRLNNDDTTSPWRPLKGELALQGMSGRVEVMARDVSGNESLIQSISVSTEADSPSTNSSLHESPRELPGGCAATPGALWALLGLGLPGIWRRRRRGR
ncbi:MAG: hypothetical protein VX699_08765 [Myxococcota bacterium]|nr:hypothetical protein [Myxococcota bacterium]